MTTRQDKKFHIRMWVIVQKCSCAIIIHFLSIPSERRVTVRLKKFLFSPPPKKYLDDSKSLTRCYFSLIPDVNSEPGGRGSVFVIRDDYLIPYYTHLIRESVSHSVLLIYYRFSEVKLSTSLLNKLYLSQVQWKVHRPLLTFIHQTSAVPCKMSTIHFTTRWQVVPKIAATTYNWNFSKTWFSPLSHFSTVSVSVWSPSSLSNHNFCLQIVCGCCSWRLTGSGLVIRSCSFALLFPSACTPSDHWQGQLLFIVVFNYPLSRRPIIIIVKFNHFPNKNNEQINFEKYLLSSLFSGHVLMNYSLDGD